MKALVGKVLSSKTQKTVVVAVESRWQHPIYGKTVKRTKKFLAHDELGVKEGQEVVLVACRPVSSKKRWKVTAVATKDNQTQ